MKIPQEIKHGLECCTSPRSCLRLQCEYFEGYPTCIMNLTRDALEYINELEARAPRWISINEKLPTPDTEVLASAIDNDGKAS